MASIHDQGGTPVTPVTAGQAQTAGATGRSREWLWGATVVLLLTLGFALVNRHWLTANVVTYGWDRLDHLVTSLVYNDMVRGWSASTDCSTASPSRSTTASRASGSAGDQAQPWMRPSLIDST